MNGTNFIKLFTFRSFCYWYVKMLLCGKRKDTLNMIDAATNAVIFLVIFFNVAYE